VTVAALAALLNITIKSVNKINKLKYLFNMHLFSSIFIDINFLSPLHQHFI